MKVVIIDTGCANLTSVQNALKRLQVNAGISHAAEQILAADKILLPGVGSAAIGMQNLIKLGLDQVVRQCQQPLLGICLGMQLLGSSSAESNASQPITTLGIIPQPVVPLASNGLPLPHMGWNRVKYQPGNPLFNGIDQDEFFYFVHSFAMPVNNFSIAQCNYAQDFSAAVNKDNFYGVQFHPERSGSSGSKLLQNFLEL